MPPSYVKQPTDYVKKGALRAIEPAIALLARNNVSPNTITTVGTLITIAASIVYATGHIMTAGWIMNVTAFFDVADGQVARRTGRSSVFGAFYDSTLDRVADGALMAGLAFFYAPNAVHRNACGYRPTTQTASQTIRTIHDPASNPPASKAAMPASRRAQS